MKFKKAHLALVFAALALLSAIPAAAAIDIEIEDVDGIYHVTVTCEDGTTGSGTFLHAGRAVSAAFDFCG